MAVIPHNESIKDDENENERRKCEHCMKLGHTKDKCWKLHAHPTRRRGGRSNLNKSHAHVSETS